MAEVKKVIWTDTAKNELKTIFNYYKEKSSQGANNVKNDILRAAKEIHFSEQYQNDEIEPDFRRIIVRDWKLLYKEKEGIVYIIKIFSLKRDPDAQI